MSFIDGLAYVAGVIVFFSYVPQIIKSCRTKKVDDLSLSMFYLALLSTVLYLIYAIILKLLPVIITMVFIFVITMVQIVLIYKYRTK